jgi:hypothetical protein
MSQKERDAFFEIIKDSVQLLNVAYLWNVPVDEQWRMSYRELVERINELTGRSESKDSQKKMEQIEKLIAMGSLRKAFVDGYEYRIEQIDDEAWPSDKRGAEKEASRLYPPSREEAVRAEP